MDPKSLENFVPWFRASAPYIHAFGGRTFVIAGCVPHKIKVMFVGSHWVACNDLENQTNPVVESNPPFCPFKMMTGHDCPGCGATRALNALLHGHPGVAADHNLLFVALLPIAVVLYVVWALRSVGVDLPRLRLPKGWVPVLVTLVALFWALRLLPWDPFTWLASGLS